MDAPARQELMDFALHRNVSENIAAQFWCYGENMQWHTKDGEPVRDWKSSFLNWALRKQKDQNRIRSESEPPPITDDERKRRSAEVFIRRARKAGREDAWIESKLTSLGMEWP